MYKNFNYLIYFMFFFTTQILGNPSLSIKFTRDPPQVGDNIIELEGKDSNQNNLKKENISIIAYMPAMGSMPYMEIQGDILEKNNKLFAEIEISMGGTWELTITITENQKKHLFRYAITTDIPGITDKNFSTSSQKEENASTLSLGVQRLQTLGVRIGQVEKGELTRTLWATGILEADSALTSDIVVRTSAYVLKQKKLRVGDFVHRHTPLITLDSPELLAAQREYLLALEHSQTAHLDIESLAERLRVMGLNDTDLKQLQKTRNPLFPWIIQAPRSGTILEINSREGGRVEAGQTLFVIGDLTRTFLIGSFFLSDIPLLKSVGKVEILLPGQNESVGEARFDFLLPTVSPGSQTARARLIPLKLNTEITQGQSFILKLEQKIPDLLLIPQEALLYSGLHYYVFIQQEEGVLLAKEVKIGRKNSTHIEILEGLSLGEKIAMSGTFLLGAEANFRQALPKWQQKP